MLSFLKKKLIDAQGRSEFVIAVVCDIRGFSAFSTFRESPDTAMFIKRFYMNLLTQYFARASFAKPTGDGLLLVFLYQETTLRGLSEYILSGVNRALRDFPKMFERDPMINFETPANLGFGIARGTACCLYSGKTIIDYSGRLLNLATRLNDLARPNGIVIDGAYRFEAIPKRFRSEFSGQQAYVRGVAEESPIPVFCSRGVTLPDHARYPISAQKWEAHKYRTTRKSLAGLGGDYRVKLPKEPKTPDRWIAYLECDSPADKDHYIRIPLTHAKYAKTADGPVLDFATEALAKVLEQYKGKANEPITIHIEYVPKASGTAPD